MLTSWILRQWSWKSFGIGLGAAVFGGTVARPLLVGAVKTGMELTDTATATLHKAKAEAASIRDEANRMRTSPMGADAGDLMSELQKLRAEIASLRGQMAPKGVKV